MAKHKKHVHKYHRVNLGYVSVWACAMPDCSHYMPKHLEPLVPGSLSICWNCDEEMILDPMNMQNDMPVCNTCSSINVDEALAELTKRISD